MNKRQKSVLASGICLLIAFVIFVEGRRYFNRPPDTPVVVTSVPVSTPEPALQQKKVRYKLSRVQVPKPALAYTPQPAPTPIHYVGGLVEESMPEESFQPVKPVQPRLVSTNVSANQTYYPRSTPTYRQPDSNTVRYDTPPLNPTVRKDSNAKWIALAGVGAAVATAIIMDKRREPQRPTYRPYSTWRRPEYQRRRFSRYGR